MNTQQAEKAAGRYNPVESIYATPPPGKWPDGRTIKPARPSVLEDIRLNGTSCFAAWIVCQNKKLYLRRYDTREEALEACLHYLATGERPEKKSYRNTAASERKATLKRDRRNAGGEVRYDVSGRIGHGKDARYMHVGSFSTKAEAEVAMKAFESDGTMAKLAQKAPKRRRAVAVPKPRETRGSATIIVPRAPVAATVNPWAARYGKAY